MPVQSAQLQLFVQSASSWGGGRVVEARRVTAGWTETGATWNCPDDTSPSNSQPDCPAQWNGGAFAATATGTVVQTDALTNRYVSFDVTADVVAFLASTPNHGWILLKAQEGQGGAVDYTSRQGAAAQRPLLVLELAAPTATRTITATPSHTATITHTPTVTPTSTPDARCGLAPLSGCRQPVAPGKSSLLLKRRGGTRDTLVWKWTSAEPLPLADFGNPGASTAYGVCLYDEAGGVPALQVSALLPVGAAWKAGSKGFTYGDRSGTAGGIQRVLLAGGATRRAKITVTGRGKHLGIPPLPLAQDRQVIVQIRNTVEAGRCWEARYNAPAVRNDAAQFKDGSDLVPTSARSATPTATVGAGSPTPTQTTAAGGTPTATRTPGESSAVCGNGLLEPGESCATCAADCIVGACTATTSCVDVQVHFMGAPGTAPTTATTLLGYRSTRVAIPGSGSVASVRQRVTFPSPLPNVSSLNDLDYALRVVLGRNGGLQDGLHYTVQLDTCAGAPPVTIADFACTMEGCAGGGGPIDGCRCEIVLQ